jgi:Zn-dependent protease with chaperone function
MLARELRTGRERRLFVIAAIVSSAVWLAMVVSVIGILCGLLLGAGALVLRCLFMARVIGNGVRIGPRQLPDLMRRIETATHKLGLNRVPEAYVLQAGGRLNAFAATILSRRFIIIHSDLLEASDVQNGSAAGSDAGSGHANELDFVIGRELGHLAAGHLAMRIFLLPARLVPLLGTAYARACEYTSDRCGHAVTGDLAISSRSLAILAAGPRTGRRLDLDAYVDQRRETRRFWMGIYELNASRPFLSKRVAALRAWQGQGTVERIGRNPFSYLLAPLFAFAAGDAQSVLLIIVAFIGLAAAVAIPRLRHQMDPTGGSAGQHDFKYEPERADPFAPADRGR